MRRMPDGIIDLIVTDPPYYSTDLAFDKETRIDFENWLRECKRILKPHGVLVSFADFNLLAELRSKKVFKTNYELIWQKTLPVGFLNANKRPLMGHEFIGVFVNGRNKSTYNPQKTEGKAYVKENNSSTTAIYGTSKGKYMSINEGDRHPISVLKFSQDKERNHTHLKELNRHPTQKPLDLVKWLINTYSNQNELVFDGFMGGGTTTKACLELNRRFIGCELHKPYYEMTMSRLLAHKPVQMSL
jgi:site-specific DNA-methyltransferase (adenine-specific)